MSRIPKFPTAHVRNRRAERRIEELEKAGAGPWVYVGTWPTDNYTTYWSPAWQNNFTFVTDRQVAFRHDRDGLLEFKGMLDLTAGAVTGTVAFTLPDDWLGETFDFPFPIFISGTDWQNGVMSVDGTTGDCTVYWPIQATAI